MQSRVARDFWLGLRALELCLDSRWTADRPRWLSEPGKELPGGAGRPHGTSDLSASRPGYLVDTVGAQNLS